MFIHSQENVGYILQYIMENWDSDYVHGSRFKRFHPKRLPILRGIPHPNTPMYSRRE